MPKHSWILTDVSSRTWIDEFSIAVAGTSPDAGRVEKYTLRGGVSEGVDVVAVHNGRLALALLPTRGMGLWRGTCDGLPLGWQSPVEHPVHPAFVDVHDRGGIGWLTGFNEWLCRCGLDANGPPGDGITLHGRIANIPAHHVRVSVDTDGPGTIEVQGVVDEAIMFGPRLRLTSTLTTTLGSPSFSIRDEVTNLAGHEADLQLLYHTQFGPPFLEAGSQLDLPAGQVVPRDPRAAEGAANWKTFLGPTAGYAEQVYYFQPVADAQGQTHALLRNAAGSCGVSLRYRPQELPCFALWKNTQAAADGYCTGLEPATNFPNPKAFERTQGRVVRLAPGASRVFHLEFEIHSTSAGVATAQKQIASLQPGTTVVSATPQRGWSPAGG
jgi:galactose mutarotase-like enzyme